MNPLKKGTGINDKHVLVGSKFGWMVNRISDTQNCFQSSNTAAYPA
jgi:hypothetical protein